MNARTAIVRGPFWSGPFLTETCGLTQRVVHVRHPARTKAAKIFEHFRIYAQRDLFLDRLGLLRSTLARYRVTISGYTSPAGRILAMRSELTGVIVRISKGAPGHLGIFPCQ